MTNKKIEKALNELRNLCKDDKKITMVLAIADKDKLNTTFQGSIMDVANLLANFKDTDREFRMADQFAEFLRKAKKAVENDSGIQDFMKDMMADMEKKNGKKADC